MVQAGAHVKEEVVRSLIVLITNAEDLHAYASRRLFAALQQHLPVAETSLMTAAAWCLGEFGELLPAGVHQRVACCSRSSS
jgi:AP-1 complex subunit gamma-1